MEDLRQLKLELHLSDHGFRSGPNPNPNLWVLPRVHTWESFTPLAAQTETSPQVTVKIS